MNEPDYGPRHARSSCDTKPHAASCKRAALWFALLATLQSVACGNDDANDDASVNTPKCLDALPDCEAGIDPSFSQIYEKIIFQRCGGGIGGGTSCHSSTGLKGGLGFINKDESYAALLGLDKTPTHARVKPGEPECSILMQRVASTDPAFRMPFGEKQPLSDGLRCAIQQWIKAGAKPE